MLQILSNLFAKTPLSESFDTPGVELPTGSNEPLTLGNDKELALDEPMSEKCDLRIQGMTCGACVEVCTIAQFIYCSSLLTSSQSIEGVLREQPGIHSIKVALLAERGVVEFDPATWSVEKIVEVRLLDSNTIMC